MCKLNIRNKVPSTINLAQVEMAMIAAIPQPFVTCYYDEPPANCKTACCKQEQEGTTPMNTERDYLNRRLNEVSNSFDRDLRKQFHIDENDGPRSYKELIDWIKNDKFKINAKIAKAVDVYFEEDGIYYGSFLEGIIWTGRGWTSDRLGYNVAREAMLKAHTVAKDTVNTGDAAAGLKALQDFQSWMYTPVKA